MLQIYIQIQRAIQGLKKKCENPSSLWLNNFPILYIYVQIDKYIHIYIEVCIGMASNVFLFLGFFQVIGQMEYVLQQVYGIKFVTHEVADQFYSSSTFGWFSDPSSREIRCFLKLNDPRMRRGLVDLARHSHPIHIHKNTKYWNVNGKPENTIHYYWKIPFTSIYLTQDRIYTCVSMISIVCSAYDL